MEVIWFHNNPIFPFSSPLIDQNPGNFTRSAKEHALNMTFFNADKDDLDKDEKAVSIEEAELHFEDTKDFVVQEDERFRRRLYNRVQ